MYMCVLSTARHVAELQCRQRSDHTDVRELCRPQPQRSWSLELSYMRAISNIPTTRPQLHLQDVYIETIGIVNPASE